MGFSLVPRQDHFFDLFEKQADLLVRIARKFREMLENYGEVERYTLEIKELEHQADVVTHEIFDLLNKSFVTPIDPEDIHSLGSALDDVIDDIEGAAARFQMFSVRTPTPEALQLTRILEACALAVAGGVKGIRNVRKEGRDGILKFLIEINDRESEADALTRGALSELFKGGVDVVDIIRWRELYARMEHAADRAEDVGNILENICVKNG